jgi:hypothetical protein
LPVVPRPEFLRLPFRLRAIPSIPLLQLTGENFRVSFHLIDLVIGQLAPLLLDLALHLIELAFRYIFVHATPQSQPEKNDLLPYNGCLEREDPDVSASAQQRTSSHEPIVVAQVAHPRSTRAIALSRADIRDADRALL